MSVDATGTGVVSHAGAALLLRTAEKSGLTSGLSAGLQPWRKPLATHDPGYRVGRKVLIRTDGAGGTHTLIEYLTKRSLSYSIGFTLTETMVDQTGLIPRDVWPPAYDSDRQIPPSRMGRRADRAPRPDRLACGNAGDCRQGTTPPRRPVAIHRHRRAATDRVRHQHTPRTVARSRTAAPPPRPLRGPDPQRERYWSAKSSTARVRSEPDLEDFAD